MDHTQEDQKYVEKIARVAHEVSRAYCVALGDLSQPPWEEAPEWRRQSARNGVLLHADPTVGPAASQQAKDFIFRAVVQALMSSE